MNKDTTQVIQELDNGLIRVFNIVEIGGGTDDDPLLTIHIDGYTDIEP